MLTIHSRRAAAEAIAIVEPRFPGRSILHWLSGTMKQLEAAAAAGFFFSFNSSILASKSGVSLVRAMPMHNVLTEMDGPFVRLGQRPATSADSADVVKSLAKAWDFEPLEAKRQITQNLRSLVTL